MNLAILIIGGLATWRVSNIIVYEDGPRAIFARLRAFLASKQKIRGGLFDLVSCVGCTSMYVGAVAALLVAGSVSSFILYTLAFSAISVIVERLAS